MIWAYLMHLGYNMWGDWECEDWGLTHVVGRPYLRFDTPLWEELKPRMRDAGINMVVIDLGEGVNYKSHPELAVSGSWEKDKLRDELACLREMGMEPIPKLNFSTTHDLWLGPYSRMVSTPEYYQVCTDLIAEVCDIFDRPRYFHLGMDEETWEHQRFNAYVVVRQFNLWWHDFMKLVETVETNGSLAWIWSDYIWHHYDQFVERMPKSVMQSNWYYGDEFSQDISWVKAYNDLEAHGFDQVPTGSNWCSQVNFERTVEYCSNAIAPERLKGFMQSVWRPMLPDCRDRHMEAIQQLAEARKSFEK